MKRRSGCPCCVMDKGEGALSDEPRKAWRDVGVQVIEFRTQPRLTPTGLVHGCLHAGYVRDNTGARPRRNVGTVGMLTVGRGPLMVEIGFTTEARRAQRYTE